MNFKKLLSEAIDNNTKIIITGKSGWGKSEMIAQVAEEKGMELIDFRLSEVLPEDLIGIPKVKDDYYEYVPPKWLYDVVNNPDKKYLLFLDEITQGTPEVLNICYKIFDKVTKVGNYTLDNVAVVGATNYQDESNYLSELPQPLKKRACMLELRHSSEEAANYLVKKYDFDDPVVKRAIKTTIELSNPRSTEKAINLIMNNCAKELSLPYIGLQAYTQLNNVLKLSKTKTDGLSNLDQAMFDLRNGYIEFKKQKFKIQEAADLSYLYELSEEENSVIENMLNDPSFRSEMPKVEGLLPTFLSTWAASKPDIGASLLDSLQGHRSFNPLQYIKQFKITTATMTNQFETLRDMLGKTPEDFLRLLCTHRTLPIEVMKLYRNQLPWDLLAASAKKGWLTKNKMIEFKKELSQYASN